MRLESNCEIVGTLSGIKIEGSHKKLVFVVAHEIELPSDAFSDDQLREVVGRRVGIINIDNQFFIREITGE